MTFLSKYPRMTVDMILVSSCLVSAQVLPQPRMEQRESVISEMRTSEPNQIRTLSWGSHESIKACSSCHMSTVDHKTAPAEAHLKLPLPQLCMTCHTAFSERKGWVHGPVASGACLTCHVTHQAKTHSLLKEDPPQLCHQCHEASSLNLIPRHSNPVYADCQACHDAHAGGDHTLLKPEFLKARELFERINPKVPFQTTFVGQDASIQGMDGIEVKAVMDRAQRFETYGITPQKLHQRVVKQLDQYGIPVLTEETRTNRTGVLVIQLRLVEVPAPQSGQIVAVAGSLSLSLRQIVALAPVSGDDTHRTCSATTWETGNLVVWGTRQCERGLAKALEVFLRPFVHAYKQENRLP